MSSEASRRRRAVKLVNTGWCGKESNPTIAFVASLREGEGDAISQVHGPHARPMITSENWAANRPLTQCRSTGFRVCRVNVHRGISAPRRVSTTARPADRARVSHR